MSTQLGSVERRETELLYLSLALNGKAFWSFFWRWRSLQSGKKKKTKNEGEIKILRPWQQGKENGLRWWQVILNRLWARVFQYFSLLLCPFNKHCLSRQKWTEEQEDTLDCLQLGSPKGQQPVSPAAALLRRRRTVVTARLTPDNYVHSSSPVQPSAAAEAGRVKPSHGFTVFSPVKRAKKLFLKESSDSQAATWHKKQLYKKNTEHWKSRLHYSNYQ